MSEFERIKRIDKILGPQGPRVLLGIGDDAAIVEAPKTPLLLCTDAMVENVHFDLRWTTAADLGHKALAASLSDIAAMNGVPLQALISIAMPETLPTSFLDEFYESAARLAKTFRFDIVGGDLSSSKSGVFIDVACVGTSEAPLRRSGAQVGDWLAVSGTPGASAAGLQALRTLPREQVPDELAAAHLRPTPRFDLLPSLALGKATSLIDISDGLASEAHHLSQQSQVGFVIDEALLPLNAAAVEFAQTSGANALVFCLYGGEDYELLTTFDAATIARLGHAPPGFTLIGRAVEAASGVSLHKTNGELRRLEAKGFNHFR